jgi:hypothetical protein
MVGGKLEVDIVARTNRCAEKLKWRGRRKRMKFKQEVEECSGEMERLRGCHDLTNSNRFFDVQ